MRFFPQKSVQQRGGEAASCTRTFHTVPNAMAEQIAKGKTLLISGGTGTGKTTLLNIVAQAIPEDERIVVIEDTAELRIEKPNIVAVECQTDTFKARISFDDLLTSALRWRPDRIILGDVRGSEAPEAA